MPTAASGKGRKRRRGTRAVVVDIDIETIHTVIRELGEINQRTRVKIIRKGLRLWGRKGVKNAKRNVSWKSRLLKRSIVQKGNSYPKGSSAARTKRIWLGIGVKRYPGTIREDVGARAHFYEGGWTPWPKGRQTHSAMTRELLRNGKPKRRGNYRGQPAARMRAILAFARRMNHWRKRFRRIQGGKRYWAVRYLRKAAEQNIATLDLYMRDAANEAINEVARRG